MATIQEEVAIAEVRRQPLISWGAVFAGMVFVLALSWLLFLLGSALGLSLLDATDAGAPGKTFGIGAVIWLVLTAVVVYFLGGLLAARLAGQPDRGAGLLHGVTLWSLATTVLLVLGYWGVSGLVGTGHALLQGAAGAGRAAVSGAVQGAGAVGAAAGEMADTSFAREIQGVLERRVSQIVAESQAGGTPPVSAGEVRSAARQIDAETAQRAAAALVQGRADQAREILAEDTELSDTQIESIVTGLERRAQDLVAEAERTELGRELKAQVDQALVRASEATGGEVRPEELRSAAQELDPSTVAAAAQHMVLGQPERAKQVLAAQTSLTREEVDALVEGASDEAEAAIDRLEAEAAQVAETASDYAQTVLWASFLGAALALAAAIAGGWAGAQTVSRLYAIEATQTVRT